MIGRHVQAGRPAASTVATFAPPGGRDVPVGGNQLPPLTAALAAGPGTERLAAQQIVMQPLVSGAGFAGSAPADQASAEPAVRPTAIREHGAELPLQTMHRVSGAIERAAHIGNLMRMSHAAEAAPLDRVVTFAPESGQPLPADDAVVRGRFDPLRRFDASQRAADRSTAAVSTDSVAGQRTAGQRTLGTSSSFPDQRLQAFRNEHVESGSFVKPRAVVAERNDPRLKAIDRSGTDSLISANTSVSPGESAARINSPAATNAPVSSGSDSSALQASVSQQLADRLVSMTVNGNSVAKLQLQPAELGALEIRIVMHDDGAVVTINAQQPHAREVIEAGLPRLRELFDGSGTTLLDVDVSGDGGDGSDDRATQDAVSDINSELVATATSVDSSSNSPPDSISNRLLDLYA